MLTLNQRFMEILAKLKINKNIMLRRAPRPETRRYYRSNENSTVPHNTLQITTPCGKLLHTFNGFVVGNNLKVKEREFIVDSVIYPFLKKYGTVLNKYMVYIEDNPFHRIHDDRDALLEGQGLHKIEGGYQLRDTEGNPVFDLDFKSVKKTKRSVYELHVTKFHPKKYKDAVTWCSVLYELAAHGCEVIYNAADKKLQKQQEHFENLKDLLEPVCKI